MYPKQPQITSDAENYLEGQKVILKTAQQSQLSSKLKENEHL